MLIDIGYRRENVYAYADKWALKRNPNYMDFEKFGGDCTNFASQCILAGSHVMNYTKTFGWYYNSPSDRAPAWTGVKYLYNFLVKNEQAGPFAEERPVEALHTGDVIQLGHNSGEWYHSLVVMENTGSEILICTHTYDAHMRPLSSYQYDKARGIHILGTRKYL